MPFSNPIVTFLAVWSFLRRARHGPGSGEGSVAGILQFAALVAYVPQVAIAAVNLLAACSDGMPCASA